MISAARARAIAVGSAERSTRRSVPQVLGRLGVVQLDTISALARAHQLTLATRARVDVAEVDRQLWSGARPVAFETWAHAASLVPVDDWPIWAFRRRGVQKVWDTAPPEAAFARELVARVAAEGPLPIQSLRAEGEVGGGWDWGPTRIAVEHLIRSGRLVCARRTGFRRIVDLPERVIPPELLAVDLTDDACLDRLVTRALGVLGIATVADVADYLRIGRADALAALDRTAAETTEVEGWPEPARLAPGAALYADRRPAVRGRFVGPFDNLIWYRPRVRRLFGFEHTLEAYLPAAKRQHGYYVCPLLAGTSLIGRADLSAGRGVLRIGRLSFVRESPRHERALAAAVRELAGLVGADRVEAAAGPTWASALAAASADGDLGLEVRLVA